MKVFVIGSGGREHALIWKIAQSKKVSKIYCAPGNGGIEELAECVNIKADDIELLLNFAINNNIDLTVVGPEVPLVKGIVDKFKENGLKIFGPDKKSAQLEGSKIFSKKFMVKYDIPTARYKDCNDPKQAMKELKNFKYPLVIKADGLAAGKGVIICFTEEEAKEAIRSIMENRKFGVAGESIIIEEYLEGIEASLLCLLDGERIIPMESARDYKKIYDGDKGPNTGGVGCLSPNPIFNDKLQNSVKRDILEKIKVGLKEENIDFRGVLFIGLMITKEGPKVLEFNVRMGDPETQVVLPRLESDLVEIFEKVIAGNLKEEDLKWTNKSSIAIIAASEGYPGSYEKDKEIFGLDKIDKDIIVFHAGTKKTDNKIFTNGGRVLALTALGNTLEEAREKAYDNIRKINFDGMYYRKDIGALN